MNLQFVWIIGLLAQTTGAWVIQQPAARLSRGTMGVSSIGGVSPPPYMTLSSRSSLVRRTPTMTNTAVAMVLSNVNNDDDDVVSKKHKEFGLLGGFVGDEDLLAEMEWCHTVFGGGDAERTNTTNTMSVDSFQHLLRLLENLPSRSRTMLITKILAKSPMRNELLETMFNHCILRLEDNKSDDDSDDSQYYRNDDPFVSVLTDSPIVMDPNKYSIIQAIILLLPFCTPERAENVCRRYCTSASTRYQSPFLCWAVKQPLSVFSNDELWEFFQRSPGQVQANILEAVKQVKVVSNSSDNPREDLLRRAIEEGASHDTDLIFYTSSDYLESKLDLALIQELGFQRWKSHGDMYLKFIRDSLQQETTTNPLTAGKLWKDKLEPAISKKMKGNIESKHIHALHNILKECRPLEYTEPHLPRNVKVYLDDLAEQGQDLSSYQAVQPIVLDARYYNLIPKKERIQISQQAIQDQDWATFELYKNRIELAHFPFEEKFKSYKVEDLWNVISGKMLDAENKGDHVRFLLFFMTTDFTKDKHRKFTIDALWSWHEWHLRCTPDKLTEEQIIEYARATGISEVDLEKKDVALNTLWKLWYESLKSRYLDNGLAELTAARVQKAAKEHRPQERSRITLDARYGHKLLEIGLGGIQAIPSSLPKMSNGTLILQDLRKLLGLYGVLDFPKPLTAVDNLNEALEQAALHEVLPRLSEVLQFDPSSEQYVSYTSCQQFQYWAEWLVRQAVVSSSGGKQVLKALSSQVTSKVLSDATYDDHHVALPNHQKHFTTVVEEHSMVHGAGTVKIVYFDHQQHLKAKKAAQAVLTDILEKSMDTDDLKDEQLAAWDLLIASEFGADREMLNDKKNIEEIARFLVYCERYLPQILVEEAEPAILKGLTTLALHWKEQSGANKKEFHEKLQRYGLMLHKHGLLLEALKSDGVFEEDDRKALLLQTQSYSYEEVRESLVLGTNDVDGEKRVAGRQRLLRSAFSEGSLPLLASAIEYTAGRIANEAGHYRCAAFDYVADSFDRFSIVSVSLDSATEETMKACKLIMETLVAMLKNDLARRDSTAGIGLFQTLSGKVIRNVLAHDPTSCAEPTSEIRRELRQLWISFSIQIDWLQTRAGSGEQGLMTYRMQASNMWELKAATLIPSSLFDEAYPRPECSNQLAGLRQCVNLAEVVVDNLEDHFAPADFVGCLENALDDVWDPKFPCLPLSWRGSWVPEAVDIRGGLCDRLLALFSLCDLSWEEVPQLTRTFDRTFDNLKDAPEHHFLFASDLLQRVLGIYEPSDPKEDTAYYEVPRLADAVSSTFEYAVKKNLTDHINLWFPNFCMQTCNVGSTIDMSKAPRDARFLSFLAKYACPGGCEPPVSSKTISKMDMVNRQVGLAKVLISMSSSAILTEPVKDALETERQDILDSVLSRVGGDTIEGPFGSMKSDKLLYEWLKPSELGHFSPSITQKYADFALQRASDPNASVQARVEAIENFVACPSTGFDRVMMVLEDEELAEPIREAIIVKVFSLDSPWHIVSFLLNRSLDDEGKRHLQRMAASLLGHVTNYVQADTVILMLGMLLDDSRRASLGFQLHKAIIRLLFDNRTPEAARLLQQEWEHSIPMEIRLIMVEKCMDAIVSRAPNEAVWEWSIVESLAETKDAPKELLAQLFKPAWQYCTPDIMGISSIRKLAEEHYLEVVTGQLVGAHSDWVVSEDSIREKYYGLLQTFEDTLETKSWKMLARAYRLTFSVPADDMGDDMAAVEEMKKILTKEGDSWDEVDKFVTRSVSQILVRTCANSLNKERNQHPAKELSVTCDDNETAKHVRECIGVLLERVLDLPVRQLTSDERSILAVTSIVSALRPSVDWFTVLVVEHFKDQASLLDKDGAIDSLGIKKPHRNVERFY